MLAAPLLAFAGDMTAGEYIAGVDKAFSGEIVNACLREDPASSTELRLAYEQYTKNTNVALGRFLGRMGRDASVPVPGGEASLLRLRARAAEFLGTVDFPAYCPQLAASLRAATVEAVYASLVQAFMEANAQTSEGADRKVGR